MFGITSLARLLLNRAAAGLLLSLMASGAQASFHLWDVVEVYTSADGSVVYVELFTASNGQQFLPGHNMVSRDSMGNVVATFDFAEDSPSPTANRSLLLATSGFANIAGVTPDVILPANFLSADGGSVNFADADTLTFTAFPADETQSFTESGFTDATPTNFAGETGSLAAIDPNVLLLSSLLPASRSVEVGNSATVFATVINSGSAAGVDCGIEATTSVAADFTYQTTDAATNALTGTPNTPVDIAGNNGSQSFLLAITPTAAFGSTDVAFRFFCDNGADAPVFAGLNTLLLSASDTPIPDIVALAATASADGVVNIPATTGTGAFATSTVNVGSAGSIDVTASTGAANLPVAVTLCQSDPVTAVCVNPTIPTGRVSLTVGANETPTFSLFVTGQSDIPFDPAGSRVFIDFRDGDGVVRGSTSVAVRTLVE